MERPSAPTLTLGGGLALSLALGLLPTRSVADSSAGWFDCLHPTATAEASYVENISRTSYESSRQDAATFAFDLGGSVPRQLARSVLLVGSGELSSLFVNDFELTNHFTATGRLMLQKKFGLGPQAWVLQASAGAGYKAARFDDDRGWTTEAGLELAKRVLPNLRFAGYVRWLEHNAKSAVFDLNQFTCGIDARWDITDRWTLSGDASWLKGNIVANAAWPVWDQMLDGYFGQTIHDYYTSRPWTITSLYGPSWVSYNVDADVNLWSATLTYAVTEKASLDLRYSAAYAVNEVDVTYPSDSWSLRLNYRF